MREILFRGKNSGGEWEYGVPVFTGLNNELAFMKQMYSYDHQVIPKTVGQFTGLTDKNGIKIFEGDIVRCISRTDMANMVVIFEEGEFRMVLCEKYKEYIPGCGFYAIRCFDKEVIGNIHDNPELLEVDDDD